MVHGLGPSQDDSQGCSRPPVMKVHDGVMIMCDICVSAGVSVSTVSGQSPRAANAAAGLGMSKSAAKKESITARLSAGEPPWDMLSLKAAIHAALPGRHPLPTKDCLADVQLPDSLHGTGVVRHHGMHACTPHSLSNACMAHKHEKPSG